MSAPPQNSPSERFVTLATAFDLDGPVLQVAPLGAGLINTTLSVRTAAGGRYVLQRLNRQVFPDPAAVMQNLRRVTSHLAGVGVPTLELIRTRGGADWLQADPGETWRCTRYLAHSRVWQDAPDPGVAYRAACAFGRFAAALADLPAPRLHETIPGFHDTPARLQALREAIAADRCGRVREAARESDAVLQRAAAAEVLQAAARAGELRERVVHNDTKLNNVLFDRDSGEVLSVIDLDTVMPGLLPHDFGDLVRSAAAVAGPDSLPVLDPARFAALAEGYVVGAGRLLTPAERHYLAVAPAVITLELAARFLTDYLQGDRYFQIRHPQDNLQRCRTQLALLGSLERQADDLRRTLAAVAARPA
jgi:aminoglycoside phosphotransferase (APT) family kinase protein